jgi:hypothetical protein
MSSTPTDKMPSVFTPCDANEKPVVTIFFYFFYDIFPKGLESLDLNSENFLKFQKL